MENPRSWLVWVLQVTVSIFDPFHFPRKMRSGMEAQASKLALKTPLKASRSKSLISLVVKSWNRECELLVQTLLKLKTANHGNILYWSLAWNFDETRFTFWHCQILLVNFKYSLVISVENQSRHRDDSDILNYWVWPKQVSLNKAPEHLLQICQRQNWDLMILTWK